MKLFERLRDRRTPATDEAAPSAAAPPPVAELRWPIIEASSTPERPGLILQLIAKELDGMMVRGVFTPDEVDRAIRHLDAHRHLATPEPFGSMLGMPLYQADPDDRTGYRDTIATAQPIYTEAFGFDPHERLAQVLAPMAGDLPFVPAEVEGETLNPGNVRWYDPGLGGLRTHAGNEFVDIHELGSAAALYEVNEIRDHMSYFVVLQPSEEGGDLSVYDMLYVDRPDELGDWDGAGREHPLFEAVPRQRLAPGPGDLLIFGGGWRYHRVDPIGGSIPRITYGGFSRLDRSGRLLQMWA